MEMTVQRILDAWIGSGADDLPDAVATEEEIESAERTIGGRLPGPLRELYTMVNGGWMMELDLLPLERDPPMEDWSLTRHTESLIRDGYRMPREVRLFAGDGGEDMFGIWMGECANRRFNHPIVEVSLELFHEEGCMGIVGTNLVSFLRGWCAYKIHLKDKAGEEGIERGLRGLGVPPHLWHEEFYANTMNALGLEGGDPNIDHHFHQLRKWADPGLTDPYGDAYNQRYRIADLRRILG